MFHPNMTYKEGQGTYGVSTPKNFAES